MLKEFVNNHNSLKDIPVGTLIDKLKSSAVFDDSNSISKAVEVAEKAHSGQRRITGEPYICHPLRCALILLYIGIKDIDIYLHK